MPEGSFRIVGPVRMKRTPHRPGFLVQVLDKRRWRKVAVTYFAPGMLPTAAVIKEHIVVALGLRGDVEMKLLV